MPDIGRLSVSSSTPIWNMSYKQWRRTRRGIHPFDLHQISNLYLYHTKDIVAPLKSAVSYKSPSAMCSTTSILLSLPSSICGCQCEWCNIWFSDVYRRPSIKTVYEPMPDDRPRCSSACCENSILALLSLKLLRIPSRDRLFLLGQPLRTSFDIGTCFMWEGLAIGVLLSSSFSFSKQQEWKDETEALYHTLQLLKLNWS